MHDAVPALPCRFQFIGDVGRDFLDVLHNPLRAFEHENIQLLKHVPIRLALVGHMYIVGGIDIAVADQINGSYLAGKAKDFGQLCEFLFHTKSFLGIDVVIRIIPFHKRKYKARGKIRLRKQGQNAQ
jgi:hypothetical protein